MDLLNKNLIHWNRGLVAKVGKVSDLEKYIKDNTDFPNWKSAQQRVKYNYEYPLKCPAYGIF